MNDDDLRFAFTDLLSDLPEAGPLPPATARRVARRRGLKQAAVGAGAAAALVTVLMLVLTGTPSRIGLPVPPATVPIPSSSQTQQPSPTQAATDTTTDSPIASATVNPSVGPTQVPTEGGSGSATSSGPGTTGVRVVLRPDGLGFTDGGSSTSALAFGTSAGTVRSAVERGLGGGTQTPSPDCGQGTSTVQHDGLFLVLRDGEFVGWVSGTPGTTTGDGLGVGSTLAQLRASLAAVEVRSDTLGPEWSTVEGGLAGFLDGTKEASAVTSIAAGVRCLAR